MSSYDMLQTENMKKDYLKNDKYFAGHVMKVAETFNNYQSQWCMYFWIPQEIHMKRGKMAGQVAHAASRLTAMMVVESIEEWEKYIDHEVKIVYKVPTVDDMFKVRDELLQEYPIEYHTIVLDNTWEKYTVFGIATKRDLKNKKWKLA